ncbi:MAG: helix-turn-helix transcriptional regulator [Abditibacteriota bacterium]|nr:helix-turn-helix transcriptional regulator [Abditibacteriota bacterium]
MSYYNEKEYDMFIIKIGLRVGYYRRLANMTQQQLSEYSGMSLNFISQLEGPSAPYVPSLKSLYKISKALGVSVSKLTDTEED